jgi:AcrR family transcriptional regulator
MGRRGWTGSPPADDAEARKLIVDAAARCIEQQGAARLTLSDVATELGITRKTVYRYFSSTEELFTAVAGVAIEGWIAELESLVAAGAEPVSHLVEMVAFIIEQLPDQPLLALLIASDRTAVFSRQMLLPETIGIARTMLASMPIDWAELGYDDTSLNELVEFMIRLIQSMVIAPPEPPRSPAQLRAYLHRWMGPALVAGRDLTALR